MRPTSAPQAKRVSNVVALLRGYIRVAGNRATLLHIETEFHRTTTQVRATRGSFFKTSYNNLLLVLTATLYKHHSGAAE